MLLRFLSLMLMVCLGTSVLAADKKKVIFDTDMGNDADDALAQMMLYHYLEKSQMELLAILINKGTQRAAVATDIFAQHYGYGDIPMGLVDLSRAVKGDDGWFLKQVVDARKEDGSLKFKRAIDETTKLSSAVPLLRKILSQQPDQSVHYVSIGFLSNLAQLLESTPDEFSAMDGKTLVAKKVKQVSLMAGAFSEKDLEDPAKAKREFNVITDIPASKYVLEHCPVPMIFSGWEIGANIRYPREVVDEYFGGKGDNPILDAYEAASLSRYKKEGKYDWPTYDLTSVLYVMEPEFFKLSESGRISMVDHQGRLKFEKDANGQHRYMLFPSDEDREAIKKRLIETTAVAPRKN